MPTLAAPTMLDRYIAQFPGSRRRYDEAKKIFPDGVTHEARSLEPFPSYFDRQRGARKWDIDGNEFIDYWTGHGSMLLRALASRSHRGGAQADQQVDAHRRPAARRRDRMGPLYPETSPECGKVALRGLRHRGDAHGDSAGVCTRAGRRC